MANISTTTLRMTRQFRASADSVFDAWLNPALMRRWLFTREGTNKVATSEPHVGGHWHITDHRDGTDYTAIGTYVEIDRPRRLVFTFQMPQFSELTDTITVELRQLDVGCEMVFTQHIHVPHEDNWSEADIEQALEAYRSSSEHGWALMLGGLDLLLSLQSEVERRVAHTPKLDDDTVDAIYAAYVDEQGEEALNGLRYLGYVQPEQVAATGPGRALLRYFASPDS